MDLLEGVGLEFSESMESVLTFNQNNGNSANSIKTRFDVTITIDNLKEFIQDPQHDAELKGTISLSIFEKALELHEGKFNLFVLDPETNTRQITYIFTFYDSEKNKYLFKGHKNIKDEPGFDSIHDMTHLQVTIYKGGLGESSLFAKGELTFDIKNTLSLVSSIKIVGAKTWYQKSAAYAAFFSFTYNVIKNEYFKKMRLFYETQYENIVLSGYLKSNSSERRFFLVSGIHDMDFPWGDGETFSDVLLVIENEHGEFQRFCITDRILFDLMLSVEKRSYSYKGPIFEIIQGNTIAYSDLKKHQNVITHTAEFSLKFAPIQKETVSFPFPIQKGLLAQLKRISIDLFKKINAVLSSEKPLGMCITPYCIEQVEGHLSIVNQAGDKNSFQVIPSRTFGQLEKSTFFTVKEPSLLYNYVCAIDTSTNSFCVQIHPNTLRNERQHWLKDRCDALVGTVLSKSSSAEIFATAQSQSIKNLNPRDSDYNPDSLIKIIGEPLLIMNNDHFPTAIFQRRISKVKLPSGVVCLALEENMDILRKESINSNDTITVAAIHNQESKFEALDKVLDITGFDNKVDELLVASRKSKEDFSIVIKPNFMFAYDKNDVTTYTDPELVGYLVKKLHKSGFSNVTIVEAQSTYGEYFDKRSVNEMADYLKFTQHCPCPIIDLSTDTHETKHLGENLGIHPTPLVWKNADFRISFAKNKTHSYAYYTLTIKNIYGALALPNKFKEYHCKRGIYETTIEYLKMYPVHFGLIDAIISADGPFGIFADTHPNCTNTILGGANLIAVDWVGASKMGLDPMISKYMQFAVKAFGKPKIDFVGDSTLYKPWLNVPVALTLFTHKGMDSNWFFGNLLYSALGQMDDTHFKHKNNSFYMRILRKLTNPIRKTFFLRTGENPSWGNKFIGWILWKLGY